jgi:putative chitinase
MTETSFGAVLMRLWPNGDEKIKGLRAGMIETAGGVFQRNGITSPLLVAHVMAQISHECGAGHDVVENLNYTAQRLIEVWPRHFNSGNAASYAHNPQKLANFIYNPPQHTDLGNRALSNDGWTFRGRGACQSTGRDGYTRLSKATGLDLVNNPDLVNDPTHFLECGAVDFILCGCLPYAKADDVVNVTKRLNGGTVGLAEREQWLAKWKAALGTGPVSFAPAATPAPATKPPAVILPSTPAPLPPDVPRPDPVPPVTPAKPPISTGTKAGGAAVIIGATTAVAVHQGLNWPAIGLTGFIVAGLVVAFVLLVRKFRT